MSALFRIILTLLCVPIAWFIYLEKYYYYARGLELFPYLMALAVFSMMLMFLFAVKHGETGRLIFFGWDTGIDCETGWYELPTLLPFLRGIDLSLGFDITLERWSTLGMIGGNPNIHHYHEQRLPSYNVRVNSDSFIRANLDRGINLLFASIFSIRDTEGRVKYYKVGAILYVLCWILAFIGNIGIHVSQAANYASNTINRTANAGINSLGGALGVPQERKKFVETYVQLDKGRSPIMPHMERFAPINGTSEVQHYFNVEGDDREYYIYENTPELVFTLNVKQPMCAVVPPGESIGFVSDLPPKYALNMEGSVLYRKKRIPGDLLEAIKVLIDFHELLDTYPTTASWKYVHDHWYAIVTPKYRMIARALPKEHLPEGSNGGIVCF